MHGKIHIFHNCTVKILFDQFMLQYLTGFKMDIKSETQARESGLLDELESGYEEGFEGYTDDPLISVAEEDAAEAAENEAAEGTEEPAAEQE